MGDGDVDDDDDDVKAMMMLMLIDVRIHKTVMHSLALRRFLFTRCPRQVWERVGERTSASLSR